MKLVKMMIIFNIMKMKTLLKMKMKMMKNMMPIKLKELIIMISLNFSVIKQTFKTIKSIKF